MFDFDTVIDRKNSASIKWHFYPEDVLPMWVADTDFACPPAVLTALTERIAHNVYGYEVPSKEFVELICARMLSLYGWEVAPEALIFVPSVVTGFHAACRAVGDAGDGVLIQTPVYPPFLTAPAAHGKVLQQAELKLDDDGRTFHYEVDMGAFEAAITDRTRLFLLCNPHNPTGAAYTRAELQAMADVCLAHDMVICSDEIHSDLLLGGVNHIPTAALSPEIAERTITLIAPSKTYNLPGLKCSIAIIQNADLRKRYNEASYGIVPWVNALGLVAAEAAYRHGDEWLADLKTYLTANRDAMVAYIGANMPQVKVTVPDATYLAWIDCREIMEHVGDDPHKFFLEQAKVGLNDGPPFGEPGRGFVRLNFGCPRSTLMEGLERMKRALDTLDA